MQTEQRAPMKRGNAHSVEDKAMELPSNKTCGDCVHCKRCCAIFGHIPDDEVCDWYPSRFKANTRLDDTAPPNAGIKPPRETRSA